MSISPFPVTELRQSIQTSHEIEQNAETEHGRFGPWIDIAYSELSIRTGSVQFGRPFRRNPADVGVTDDWRRRYRLTVRVAS